MSDTNSSLQHSCCPISQEMPQEHSFMAQTALLGHEDGKTLTQSHQVSSELMTALAGSWSCLLLLGHCQCRWDGISTAIPKDPGDKDLQARNTAQRDRKVLVPSDGHPEQQKQQLSL